MENLSLEAKQREVSKKELSQLREKGEIPAVIYGKDYKNQHLTIDQRAFDKIYEAAGESTLVNLLINGGEPITVIIQTVQLDPVQDTPLHVDFYKVKMDEVIETEVQLDFVGEAAAIKELGGMLLKGRDALNIKCLPKDLVKSIEVNISALNTFEDVIRLKDLDIPENIEVLDDFEFTIATVTPPRTEEELKALDEKVEVDVDSVEVEGAREEETGEEGEAGEEEKTDAKDEDKKDDNKEDKKEDNK